jgi:hypothetical protein
MTDYILDRRGNEIHLGDYVAVFPHPATHDIILCGDAIGFGNSTQTVFVTKQHDGIECAHFSRIEKIDEGHYMLWKLEN